MRSAPTLKIWMTPLASVDAREIGAVENRVLQRACFEQRLLRLPERDGAVGHARHGRVFPNVHCFAPGSMNSSPRNLVT
jgi:hypothetical protein